MASPLTDGTKTQIRMYLGWPARFRQTDSALEQALHYLDTDDALQAQVTGTILPAILAVDAALVDAQTRLKFERAGEVQTRTSEVSWLRSEGRRHVNRLSCLLAVPVREDVFGRNAGANGSGPTRGQTTTGVPGFLRRG